MINKVGAHSTFFAQRGTGQVGIGSNLDRKPTKGTGHVVIGNLDRMNPAKGGGSQFADHIYGD